MKFYKYQGAGNDFLIADNRETTLQKLLNKGTRPLKMLSEMETNRKRALFLNHMGMRQKDRLRLIKKEYFYYYYFLPIIIGTVAAVIFTFMMFIARMYSAQEILQYLMYMLQIWGGFYIISLSIMWIQMTIYARKVEVK